MRSPKNQHMNRKALFAAVVILISAAATIHTQAQSQGRFSVETDPSTFLLSGYSIHLRLQPPNCEQWLIGAGSYGIKLPKAFVDLNQDNRDKGWNAKIKNAYSLFAEYYFHRANQKWFIGEQVGIHNYHVTNDFETGASNDFSTMLLMTYVGYSWHPFKGSLYVKPWAGLGYTERISGSTSIGSRKYDIAPLFPFATFHIGYEF